MLDHDSDLDDVDEDLRLGAALHDYVQRIVFREEWRDEAMCAGASGEIVSMFTCTEDESFTITVEEEQQTVTGFDVQCYLVEAYCTPCPVQWECARHAIQVEEREAGDRSTGAWAMTRRDRRWLAAQPDALGIIDQAKIDDTPVNVAIANARAERD